MRVTLIHNPGAGRQGAGQTARLRSCLAASGYDVRYQSSKEEGWKKALRKPADLVVVAGGDGTVARVTRRMVGRGVPMAVLPSGTANNIARTLGLVERPFEELVRGWREARRVKLDVGVAAGPWGERYFVEGVGAGLFAGMLADPASGKVKARAGAVEHGLDRLRDAALHCEPVDIAAVLDGEDISGRYILLEAVNLRYVGPNLHLAHDSQPGDGQFDVVLVTETERERLVHYLEQWQNNRERIGMLPTRRGRRLQIEWTGFPLHIDDKLRPKSKVKPKQMAGVVEARLAGDTVEFLVP
ncbi:MAG TPA: diacylglycerol kinase family protein [Burkholderiales bacterium]